MHAYLCWACHTRTGPGNGDACAGSRAPPGQRRCVRTHAGPAQQRPAPGAGTRLGGRQSAASVGLPGTRLMPLQGALLLHACSRGAHEGGCRWRTLAQLPHALESWPLHERGFSGSVSEAGFRQSRVWRYGARCLEEIGMQPERCGQASGDSLPWKSAVSVLWPVFGIPMQPSW